MSTAVLNLKATPRQIRKYIIRCIMKGLVPFIKSSPAMGKSSLVKSIADEYDLCLIDHRLSTSAPEDLTGLPRFREDGTASFAPFDTFPTVGTTIPINPKTGKPYQGWLLFLDEFNSAKKDVQAAAYKLILDKAVGLNPLHPNVAIVCAGNLETDRAIVNTLGTAMQSRVITLLMELDFDEFMQDVAFKYNWDSRVTAYLNYKPLNLYDFKPDHTDNTFCAPRTWDFLQNLLKGVTYNFTKDPVTNVWKTDMEADAPLFAGAITSGVAADFIQFTKVYADLPKIPDILNDPHGVGIPRDRQTRFAGTMYLVDHLDDSNFDPLSQYVDRFENEFKILFYRAVMARYPTLRHHQAFRKGALLISKWLHDDA